MVHSTAFVTRTLTRRNVLAAALVSAAVSRLQVPDAFAQETTPAAGAPANAVSWPKFNLNSASEEHFLGIPGAGEKMAHEFEEYRPYTSIGQYRAEIGKYISEDDVAALEAYLFVPVDPNEADAETLQQLPGVNADTVEALIAGRPYADSAAFLTALEGTAGSELAAAASTFLAPEAGPVATWPKYNLNAASEQQFLSIPGAGDKMAHEFEEYRPYSSIGQYRAEIGKYISPEDVAALERYLYVPVDPNAADGDTMQQLPGMTAELASSLEGKRPFADNAAFVAALQDQVSPELVAAVEAYLATA